MVRYTEAKIEKSQLAVVTASKPTTINGFDPPVISESMAAHDGGYMNGNGLPLSG